MSGRIRSRAAALFAVVALGVVIVAIGVIAIGDASGPAAHADGASMSLTGFVDKGKTVSMCGFGAPMRKCGEAVIGESFSIDIHASAIPAEGYTQFQVVINYSTPLFNPKQQDAFDAVVWPDVGCAA